MLLIAQNILLRVSTRELESMNKSTNPITFRVDV